MSLRLRALSVGAAIALLATSCGGEGSSMARSGDDSWAGGTVNADALAELYDAAVEGGENQVVVYGALAAAYQPLWDKFNERFPDIEVVANPLSGAQISAKLDAEFASGRHEADLLAAGLVEMTTNAEADRLDSYEPVDTFDLPQNFIDPENRFVVQFGDVYGIIYNTDKLSEADLPTSLTDLTDPAYEGMVMDEPLAGALTDLIGIELHRSGELDSETWRDIIDNAQIVTRTADYYTQLSTGSTTMMPWASFTRYQLLAADGAPVGYKAIPGIGVFLAGATGLVKDAPHPNAAKLFQSWILTPEAQDALASEATAYGLMPGAERPADWPKLDKLLGALSPIDPAGYPDAREAYMTFSESALE